jgi:hypothetical protein
MARNHTNLHPEFLVKYLEANGRPTKGVSYHTTSIADQKNQKSIKQTAMIKGR